MEIKDEFVNKMEILNSISKRNGYRNFRDWGEVQNQKKKINPIEYNEIELFHEIRNIISHGASGRVIVYPSDIDKLNKYLILLNKSLGFDVNEKDLDNNYIENTKQEEPIIITKQKEKDTNNVAHKKDIVNYIEKLKEEARLRGLDTLILIAGKVEKEIGLKQRIVSICSAMYECMGSRDEVLHTVPSSYSTTVKIKYYL